MQHDLPKVQQAVRRPLLSIKQIYLEPAVRGFARGREILARFPDAETIEVPSHWNIPSLHRNEGLAKDWIRIKREVLVLGVRKTVPVRINGRSADFIASSVANGCTMGCVYCYVPRRKGFANPITAFVNIDDICAGIARHAAKQGMKLEPNQIDSTYWVYDIGENSDCSVDALISDNVLDLVEMFKTLPNAKASFATKYVNRDLLHYNPAQKTRVRLSLMPPSLARVVDVRTSPMAERIAFINDLVEADYEVHINFSPVIVYDGWLEDYAQLFELVDGVLSPAAKQQLQAEIIFLTHNEELHNVNLIWHPRAEDLLWRPTLQESKVSESGGTNVRYRHGTKGRMLWSFTDLLGKHLPYCTVRYAF
jgi:spore photoproduct lyase